MFGNMDNNISNAINIALILLNTCFAFFFTFVPPSHKKSPSVYSESAAVILSITCREAYIFFFGWYCWFKRGEVWRGE